MDKNIILKKSSKTFFKFLRFLPKAILTLLGVIVGFAILGWFAAIIGAVIGYFAGFLLEKALLNRPY